MDRGQVTTRNGAAQLLIAPVNNLNLSELLELRVLDELSVDVLRTGPLFASALPTKALLRLRLKLVARFQQRYDRHATQFLPLQLWRMVCL